MPRGINKKRPFYFKLNHDSVIIVDAVSDIDPNRWVRQDGLTLYESWEQYQLNQHQPHN